MKANRILLLLLIALPLSAQGDIFATAPRWTPRIASYPDPAYQWDFSDGSGGTVVAQVGGQNLTCSNLGWATSPTAGDFNGTTTDCDGGTILNNLTTWSVSFCLQADSRGEGNAGAIAGKGSSTTVNDWRVEIGGGSTTQRMHALGYNTSEAFERTQSPDASLDTTGSVWAHWVAVYNCPNLDPCAVQWYKNGAAVTSSVNNSAAGARRDSTGFSFRVGNRVGATDRTLDGRLRLLKIWPATLLTSGNVAVLAAAESCGT